MRSFRAKVGLIALGGLALRLIYTFALAPDVKGIGDWYFFHWGANLIADGHWFIDPFAYVFQHHAVASAGHPPLWELLLSAVSWLGGTGALAHRTVGCVVGTLTLVLIGLLGRRVGGPRVGIAAAAIAAVYPVLIAADGSLMSESLYGFLIAAALLLAFRLRERADVRSAAALGAVIALAALTRSEALLLIAILALPIALTRPRRLACAAACLAAAALVLAPWLARNWIELGRPVLISTNDGTLLAGANCHRTYYGRDIGFWQITCIPARSAANEAVQESRWRSHGIHYVEHHVGRLPLVVLARVARTWDFFQPRRMVTYAEGRAIRADQAGVAAYWLLLPFAIAGGVLIRRRRGDLLILLTPVALVTFQSVVGYGIPRFRHAAEITIVVLAGLAVTRLLDWRRRRAQVRALQPRAAVAPR
jgi:4-amino-4-deoxy-L-arabinose transferase-like glycosyltransferase